MLKHEKSTGITEEYLSLVRAMHKATHGKRPIKNLVINRIFWSCDFRPGEFGRNNSINKNSVY